jgi:hypothetical protein
VLIDFRRDLTCTDYGLLSQVLIPQLHLCDISDRFILAEIFAQSLPALRLLHHFLFLDPNYIQISSIAKMRPVSSINDYVYGVISFISTDELYDPTACQIIHDEAVEFTRRRLVPDDSTFGTAKEIGKLLRCLASFGVIHLTQTEFSMTKMMQDALLFLVPVNLRTELWEETNRWIQAELWEDGGQSMVSPHIKRCFETKWV